MKLVAKVVIRSIQLLALVSVIFGLYIGNLNRDMSFELMTLAVGAGIFYGAAYLQKWWLGD